jgi:hypothetical protein
MCHRAACYGVEHVVRLLVIYSKAQENLSRLAITNAASAIIPGTPTDFLPLHEYVLDEGKEVVF